MRIGIIILFACSCALRASDSFGQANPDSLISVYVKKIQKHLDKDGKVSEIFSFTKEGIETYQLETDTSQRKFEGIILWRQVDTLKRLFQFVDSREVRKVCTYKMDNTYLTALRLISVSKQSVSKLNKDTVFPKIGDCRIVIDPGHIGGDIETAKMEKKWVEMKPNPAKGIKEPIQLIEGNLTFAAAKILKKKLESEGATVLLTRHEQGISAFGISFEKWKDSLFLRSLDSAFARGDVSFEEKNFLLTKADATEIFRRFFLQEEMRERARRINAFHPDLTIIIHFNVDETNQSWNKPTKKNFNMAFVGGSFSADELEKPEARIDFLRLLLTGDIENSIEFSKYMVESLVEKTKVPAALDSCALYLKGNCITTDAPGVFCRNLALTRMVRGTLCYGESLYQDNIDECKALSKAEITIDGIKTSKRVQEVADAYFNGVMNYVKQKSQAAALQGEK